MQKKQKSTTASNVAPAATAEMVTGSADNDLDAQIAALQLKKREKAIADIGGDPEKVKAEIARDFKALVRKAEALKLAFNDGDKKYYAPWEIQGKRPDWPIRDFILKQNTPQTVEEIVAGVDYETDVASIQAVLDKDQKNARKLFVPHGHRWWIAGKPLTTK